MPSGVFRNPILHAWRDALRKEGNTNRRGMKTPEERIEKQRRSAAGRARGFRGRFLPKVKD